jgi:hypothetical protein
LLTWVDDLRCDAFETGEELGEFLAFVAGSRQASLAWAAPRLCPMGAGWARKALGPRSHAE